MQHSPKMVERPDCDLERQPRLHRTEQMDEVGANERNQFLLIRSRSGRSDRNHGACTAATFAVARAGFSSIRDIARSTSESLCRSIVLTTKRSSTSSTITIASPPTGVMT